MDVEVLLTTEWLRRFRHWGRRRKGKRTVRQERTRKAAHEGPGARGMFPDRTRIPGNDAIVSDFICGTGITGSQKGTPYAWHTCGV